jgi:hypothetical protein
MLEAKHFVCDFLLQTPYQLANKGAYGHPGGILHACCHGVGTCVSVLFLEPELLMISLAMGLGDATLHYHIDWVHWNVDQKLKLTPDKPGFFYSLGLDQLAHQATYLFIVMVLVMV